MRYDGMWSLRRVSETHHDRCRRDAHVRLGKNLGMPTQKIGTLARWIEVLAPLVDHKQRGASDTAWRTLELTVEWVLHADAKIGVALAFVGAEIAGAAAVLATESELSRAATGAFICTGFFALFSIVAGSAGLLPRLGRSLRRRTTGAQASVLYFGDIARTFRGKAGAFKYASELMRVSGDSSSMAEELAKQIHINSQIAVAKYRWANVTIMCAALASLALAIGLAFAFL